MIRQAMVCIGRPNLHQGTSLGLAISAFVVGAALVAVEIKGSPRLDPVDTGGPVDCQGNCLTTVALNGAASISSRGA